MWSCFLVEASKCNTLSKKACCTFFSKYAGQKRDINNEKRIHKSGIFQGHQKVPEWEPCRQRTYRRRERQASKEKRMSEMKDGSEGKLLIRWPGRQAWRKGFGLSSGPDPCLLDWHSNNPATGLILQITPPPREQRQARIGGEDCAGNQIDGWGRERGGKERKGNKGEKWKGWIDGIDR